MITINFEKTYKAAVKQMNTGALVYCVKCDSAMPRDKEAYRKHLKKCFGKEVIIDG